LLAAVPLFPRWRLAALPPVLTDDQIAGLLARFDRWLGITYARHRRHADAVRTFQELLAAQPDSIVGLSNLATALADAGDPTGTEAAWREVLLRKSDHADAHIKLANSLRQQGRREEAIAAHQERLATKPDDAGALDSIGILFEEAGRLAGAERAYRDALKHAPDAADVRNNLGMALAGQGKIGRGPGLLLGCTRIDFRIVILTLLQRSHAVRMLEFQVVRLSRRWPNRTVWKQVCNDLLINSGAIPGAIQQRASPICLVFPEAEGPPRSITR
jgi:Flp pilus assembly protein TadD